MFLAKGLLDIIYASVPVYPTNKEKTYGESKRCSKINLHGSSVPAESRLPAGRQG
jgi:hypothetical protein